MKSNQTLRTSYSLFFIALLATTMIWSLSASAQSFPFFKKENPDPATAQWPHLMAKVIRTGYPLESQEFRARAIVHSAPNNPRKNRVEHQMIVGVKLTKKGDRVIHAGFVEAHKNKFTRHELYTNLWANESHSFSLTPDGKLIAAERSTSIFEEASQGRLKIVGKKSTPLTSSEAEREWQGVRSFFMDPINVFQQEREYDPERWILLDEI